MLINASYLGSAHCVLGPFWERVLGKKDLKGVHKSVQKMLRLLNALIAAVQCYPTRGAEFHLQQLENGRVDMTGEAIVVIRGEITL
jgi:hypothetical protein